MSAQQTLRLPNYCEHKLPTSCRLSSIPGCCACSDERAHAPSYSVYIDGVGFVPRGTRWQRYCWDCKEFWQHRVETSGLRPAQTRIPQTPDQTEFLARWYEFHQGYRVVRQNDGREERVAVLGEVLRDVSPGVLPRTLEELRAGRERSALDQEQRGQDQVAEESAEAGSSLEETLDGLFLAAEAEASHGGAPPAYESSRDNTTSLPGRNDNDDRVVAFNDTPSIHAQAMVPAASRNREYQARRVAALRRELHRMRNGIERVIAGLREFGEDVPDSTQATRRLAELGGRLDDINGTPSREDAQRAINSVNALTNNPAANPSDRTLANVQARVNAARQHFDEARRSREEATAELDRADQEFRTSQQRLQQLQHEQRTTENYIRIFGTRAEMDAQGDDYESPIGAMFSRAYERFRTAEQARRDERTLRQVLEDENYSGDSEQLAAVEAMGWERDLWGVPRLLMRNGGGDEEDVMAPNGDETVLQEYYAMIRRQELSGSASLWQAVAPISNNEASQAASEIVNRANDGVQSATSRNRYESVTDERLKALMNTDGHLLNRDETSMEDMISIIRSSQPTEMEDRAAFAVILAISTNEDLQHRLEWDAQRLRSVTAGYLSVPTEDDGFFMMQALYNEDVVWTASLPALRLAESRSSGSAFDMTNAFQQGNEALWEGTERLQDSMEWMAEAYQMSSEVRSRAVQIPGRLPMLYRLQAGERRPMDREILLRMVMDQELVNMSRALHRDQISTRQLEDAAASDQLRQDRAREGDHSRQELDAQRQAARAFALAAGRTAMQTGSEALLNQMAERNNLPPTTTETTTTTTTTTRPRFAPFHTLHTPARGAEIIFDDSDFSPHSPPSPTSDPEDDDLTGLDAPDSGRPEPRAEEDMTVRMECRICYTQLAEIACLPCGHVVMCRWCSDQHSPTMAHDRTRPRTAAGCPVCRRGIRQKVRVFGA